MARDVIDYQPSDTSSNTSGAIQHNQGQVVFQFVNETAKQINYEIHGTYGADDFSDKHTIKNSSVSANSVASVALNEPWDKLRVKVTPNNSPGGSSNVIVKEHTRG